MNCITERFLLFSLPRFKWSAANLQNILEKYLNIKVVPEGLTTPPYLTAKPEVYYHRLTPNDKFLVIASDGLWEVGTTVLYKNLSPRVPQLFSYTRCCFIQVLSPDKVVRLVSDHMIGRVTLNPYVPAEGALVHQVKISFLSVVHQVLLNSPRNSLLRARRAYYHFFLPYTV